MFVPVVDKAQRPLMPTKPSRARRWIKSGKATPFWKKGVFCVRLNVEPSGRKTQPIAVGIDPGSKCEGLSVKSKAHTYLNIEADAVTWVGEAIKTRRQMRRARRFRKKPHRANRSNRSIGGIPPSTKARWQWKLRLIRWLYKLYPITTSVVEDVKARTKEGKRRWNQAFSSLEIGKRWFYKELGALGQVCILQGFETKELREKLGLSKAHWIDAWVLANWYTGGELLDTRVAFSVVPLRFHRRQLHALQPSKGGVRRPYGGTNSLGFKRGSYVQHPKWGLVYVGGYLKDRISLHSLSDGRRLFQNAKVEDCQFLTYASWRMRLLSARRNTSITQGTP